ncbi:hypothetical protein [Fusobacterium sp.]|uniref:hypothetical protein n=1 Tax=Fusobacterium sp. TaxID=68766 RepID=UPI0028FEF2CD|nr:hypothetical protein [Fusobacterium sp.]MDU1910474.1 hypothetical protein [Fusobacterium sp.]
MNREKAYFLVVILGIITLIIIFLISKFMSKIFENKTYPKDSLIEILFNSSNEKKIEKGFLKKSYNGKNNSILQIYENAVIILKKDKEKIYYFSEIPLIASFIIMNSWGKVYGYGYHFYNEKGSIIETITSSEKNIGSDTSSHTSFDNLEDFEVELLKNNTWVLDIQCLKPHDGKFKLPYSAVDKAFKRRNELLKV